MRVKDLMSRQVTACRLQDSLNTAAQVMWNCDCGVVPVINDQEQVVGMITDRDICMAAYTQGKLLQDMIVSTVMSTGVHACGPDDGVEHAEEIMMENQVHRLPVLTADGRLVGVLSLTDIARQTARDRDRKGAAVSFGQVATTLAAICAPRAPAGAAA